MTQINVFNIYFKKLMSKSQTRGKNKILGSSLRNITAYIFAIICNNLQSRNNFAF